MGAEGSDCDYWSKRALDRSRHAILARPSDHRYTGRAGDFGYRIRLGEGPFAQAQGESRLENNSQPGLTQTLVRERPLWIVPVGTL
jgi:hypothetical protein